MVGRGRPGKEAMVGSMMKHLLAIVCLGLSSSGALADWQVCNRTPDPVRVAVGYAVPNGLLKSEGWWTLGPCTGCAMVLRRGETVDNTTGYLYVERNGSAMISGSENLCVGKSPFALRRHGNNCPDTRGFKQVTIDLNKNPYTTNIRGQRTCNL